ncbi:hypothetical protein MCUN1_000015 [Malassezia cuniculi]|uniref:CRAL-TRIO domain-containing protein n=1 Tax=Malassezia cuniculi TaxID=948313 RepID=A0AAF0EUH8_9BASI|nr:hypothetical protein MCUN1_000015 [Malassezia cuniculi]
MSTKLPTPDLKALPGHYGNLDSTQLATLAKMWEALFHVMSHPEEYTKNASEAHLKPSAAAAVAEDAPPSNNLSDSDKESKAHQEEQAALADVLAHHGVQAFYDNFWFLCGPDPPDMMMLKFLRARKWDVDRAVAMLARCIKWRIESNIIDIIRKGDQGLSEDVPEFLKQGEIGKVFASGMTDDHMPVIFIEVAKHLTKGQAPETMRLFIIMCTECFRSLISYPNEKIVIVFDLGGFGLKNMDWNALIHVIQILEKYYPETLAKLYIHRAPWIFQGLWKIISGMLDPNVRAKVGFTGKAKDLDLIPLNRVPERLGGTLVDPYTWVPPQKSKETSVPVGNAERTKYWNKYMDYVSQFEIYTKHWLESKGQSEEFFYKREYILLFMRKIFIEMNPLIRGTTYYMRAGITLPDGRVVWHYKQKDGSVLEHEANIPFSVPHMERIYPEVKSAFDISPADLEARDPGNVIQNLISGKRPPRAKTGGKTIVSDVAQPRSGQLGNATRQAPATGATGATVAAGAGAGAAGVVGAGAAAATIQKRNKSSAKKTSSSKVASDTTLSNTATATATPAPAPAIQSRGGATGWNYGPAWATSTGTQAQPATNAGYTSASSEQFTTAPTAPRMSNDSDIPRLRNGGHSVYTTNSAIQSTEDFFHDTDDGTGLNTTSYASQSAAQPTSKAAGAGVATGQSGVPTGTENNTKNAAQTSEEAEEDEDDEDEDAPETTEQAVSAFEAENLDRTAHESHSKNALGIPGTSEVQGESDSPLAGFPNLSGKQGAAPIAKNNEQFKREAETAAQSKKSFLSRLNCCGGGGKVE